MKLGKKASKQDHRNLKLSSYLSILPPVPTACDWSHNIINWGMMRNDTVGDCTCAGGGHLIMGWTANASTEVIPSDTDILAAYSAITGYNPNDPNTDQGANELDVLNYWRQTGIAGHKIGAYVQLNASDIPHVKTAIYLFGGIYIGVQLPNLAMDQTDSGQVWDVVADDGGIDGGHCVVVVAYDAEGLTCITWGQKQRMTWAWWTKYVDEAYAILSNDFINGQGMTPAGFNLQELQADLKAVTN